MNKPIMFRITYMRILFVWFGCVMNQHQQRSVSGLSSTSSNTNRGRILSTTTTNILWSTRIESKTLTDTNETTTTTTEHRKRKKNNRKNDGKDISYYNDTTSALTNIQYTEQKIEEEEKDEEEEQNDRPVLFSTMDGMFSIFLPNHNFLSILA